MTSGHVDFVGAGPGAVAWITLAGAAALRQANVILVDALVSPALLSDIAWDALVIDVGKRGGKASYSQSEICNLLVTQARAGKKVVRLKGGDPGVFGRLTEEVSALKAAGISYNIIPGVTAASAVAARSGISLTDRDVSASLTLLTGHRRDAGPRPEMDWQAASRSGTGVVYMGVLSAAENAARLLAEGVPAATPVLVAASISTAKERVIKTTLGDLANTLVAADVHPPAIWLYGQVAAAAAISAQPLSRGLLAVFRPYGMHLDWHAAFAAAGWEVAAFPLQRFVAPSDGWAALDRLDPTTEKPAWLVFSSPTAVRYWLQRQRLLQRDLRQWAGWSLAAVGTATAATLSEYGLQTALIAKGQGGGDELAKLLPNRADKLYWLQAEDGRTDPLAFLHQRGWRVERLLTHAKQAREDGCPALQLALARRAITAAIWSASSQVRWASRYTPSLFTDVPLHIALGKQVAAALQATGIASLHEATEPSPEGILTALAR